MRLPASCCDLASVHALHRVDPNGTTVDATPGLRIRYIYALDMMADTCLLRMR